MNSMFGEVVKKKLQIACFLVSSCYREIKHLFDYSLIAKLVFFPWHVEVVFSPAILLE